MLSQNIYQAEQDAENVSAWIQHMAQDRKEKAIRVNTAERIIRNLLLETDLEQRQDARKQAQAFLDSLD